MPRRGQARAAARRSSGQTATRRSHRRRSTSGGSSRVVLAALGGNLAIAVAKGVAFMISGSSAMLTEAIHSVVDSIDQGLLLVGRARARKRRDQTHPLGYGMEMYFWSFIVALIVFGMGGVASVLEGVRRRLMVPGESTSVALNLSVLDIAAVFESTSFVIAFREYRKVVGARGTPLWTFIRRSKDHSPAARWYGSCHRIDGGTARAWAARRPARCS
jgi:hypothetical protein